ncbi:MAG: hypothetical protein HEQ35_28385 [Gloeotrichia echinulata IR180]|nr:hypothetical protein [Gloeotrichia echinulata DEX184]
MTRKWSQDATKQPRNWSRHRIIRAASVCDTLRERREDYGVGLLAGLVERFAESQDIVISR